MMPLFNKLNIEIPVKLLWYNRIQTFHLCVEHYEAQNITTETKGCCAAEVVYKGGMGKDFKKKILKRKHRTK